LFIEAAGRPIPGSGVEAAEIAARRNQVATIDEPALNLSGPTVIGRLADQDVYLEGDRGTPLTHFSAGSPDLKTGYSSLV
jgi:hypothetical protein